VIGFSAAEMDFGLKVCKTVQGCNQKARFKFSDGDRVVCMIATEIF